MHILLKSMNSIANCKLMQMQKYLHTYLRVFYEMSTYLFLHENSQRKSENVSPSKITYVNNHTIHLYVLRQINVKIYLPLGIVQKEDEKENNLLNTLTTWSLEDQLKAVSTSPQHSPISTDDTGTWWKQYELQI